MFFSREYLREILPPTDPPTRYVPELVREPLAQLRETDGEEVYRSGLWTYAMFSELREGQFSVSDFKEPWPWPWRAWSPYGELLIGVHDPEYEGRAFGLIFMTLPSFGSGHVGQVSFPRLERSFPVAKRGLVEDLHAPPTLPNATSTCWAQDRKRRQWGFLTCRHALSGVPVGATVGVSGGAKAIVRSKGPGVIDAAFLETGSAPTSKQMKLLRFPTAGQSVDIILSSGIAKRSVVTVTDTLGVIADPYHPIRVYLDKACQPGDSGALVSSTRGEGVGIYCGDMTNATVAGQPGQTVGFAQHLEQATEILDVDPYL